MAAEFRRVTQKEEPGTPSQQNPPISRALPEQNTIGVRKSEPGPLVPAPRILKQEEDYDDEPNAWGPPTSYHYQRTPNLVYKLALLGHTDKEIALVLGISVLTFDEWKVIHPPVARSLWKGRDIADAEVAVSLRMRAVGFTIPEEKVVTRKTKDDDGNEEVDIIRYGVNTYFPPDVGAGKIWLGSRQKNKWREQIGHEHSGPDGKDIPMTIKVQPDLSGLSLEELKLAQKILQTNRTEEEGND